MHEFDDSGANPKHYPSVRKAIYQREYSRNYYHRNSAAILRRKREKDRQNKFVEQFDSSLQPIVRELLAGPMLKREISERFGVHLTLVRALAHVVTAWGQGLDVTGAVRSIRVTKIDISTHHAA